MKIWKSIRELNRAEILSFKGVYYFVGSLLSEGINLMAVLRFSAKRYPNKPALVDNHQTVSYKELYVESRRLMYYYKEVEGIQPKQKVGLLFPNSADIFVNVYALSRLGANVLLINAELSTNQLTELIKQQQFDFIIVHENFRLKLDLGQQLTNTTVLFFHEVKLELNHFVSNKKFYRAQSGNIGVMSGGTSGNFKAAVRKPSVFSFLAPLLALLNISRIHEKSGVIITAPMFHGFGFSTAVVGFLLGKKVVMQEQFTTKSILESIEREGVEVMVAVPTVIQRLLNENLEALKHLEVIFTGGTSLNPSLSKRISEELGPVLYNLYGSSEGGFSFMATPFDLEKYPGTIGKPLYRVHPKIDSNNCLHLKGSWAMIGAEKQWWNTKDLCFKNEEGFYFITGRADDLIISGGENVHPQDVLNVLINHEKVNDVAVIGVPDETFGQRLIAFVVTTDEFLELEELFLWLKPQLARFQLPREIVFVDEIPMLETGKLDKQSLLKVE